MAPNSNGCKRAQLMMEEKRAQQENIDASQLAHMWHLLAMLHDDGTGDEVKKPSDSTFATLLIANQLERIASTLESLDESARALASGLADALKPKAPKAAPLHSVPADIWVRRLPVSNGSHWTDDPATDVNATPDDVNEDPPPWERS